MFGHTPKVFAHDKIFKNSLISGGGGGRKEHSFRTFPRLLFICFQLCLIDRSNSQYNEETLLKTCRSWSKVLHISWKK